MSSILFLITPGVFQDMGEGLVFPVDIADKVLGPLGRFKMACRLIISVEADCTLESGRTAA
jgi:hypothetical protein